MEWRAFEAEWAGLVFELELFSIVHQQSFYAKLESIRLVHLLAHGPDTGSKMLEAQRQQTLLSGSTRNPSLPGVYPSRARVAVRNTYPG